MNAEAITRLLTAVNNRLYREDISALSILRLLI